MRKSLYVIFLMFLGCLTSEDFQNSEELPQIQEVSKDSAIFEIKEDVLDGTKTPPSYLDGCPNGDECVKVIPGSICLKSDQPEIAGYKSICTVYCSQAKDTKEETIFTSLKELFGTCTTFTVSMQNNASCCGKLKDGEHYCLPAIAGFCCDYNNYFYCQEGCCPKETTQCTKDGKKCLGLDEVDCGNSFVCKKDKKCSACGCLDFSQTCCSGGIICPEDQICSEDGKSCEPKCKSPLSLYCKNECCDPNYHECVCQEQGGFCKPKSSQLCDCEKKTWCEPLWKCIENEGCIAKGHICKPLGAEDCPVAPECFCKPGEVCTGSQPTCCPQDAPVPCGDECCFSGSECSKCGCKAPGEECCLEKPGAFPNCDTICEVNEQCREKKCGCKPEGTIECDGGVDCPITDPICVGKGKGINGSGCCPGKKPIGCDGYCCDAATHCETQCKPNFKNCHNGCIPANGVCCGEFKGYCPNGYECCSIGPFSIFNVCIPSGSTCDGFPPSLFLEASLLEPKNPICGGCVENGKFCCPDGVTPCSDYGNGNKEICYSGGGQCLDSKSQDCGSYYCEAGYVCANVSSGCCPETNPKGCGNKCCETYETCYEASNGGICVNVQAGWKYCGNFKTCGPTFACCGTLCAPNLGGGQSTCFVKKDNITHCYCEIGKKSAVFDYEPLGGNTYYYCIPDSTKVCIVPFTSYFICPPGCDHCGCKKIQFIVCVEGDCEVPGTNGSCGIDVKSYTQQNISSPVCE